MALITLLGLYTLVNAIPQVALPINAQVPPVARTSTPFRFTFSASTFTSSSGTISFSLQDAPSWLQLDGDNRTLFGTPGSTDTGPATVNLTATDETGVANVQFTLVVSNSPGPQLKKPVSDQITSFGTASSLTSLAMYPSSPFSFTFAQGTFSNNGGPQSEDNTPLPSWVTFDGAGLGFSGTTPEWTSLLSPPQSFGLKLTASDIRGFAGAVASIQLVVSNHELVFRQSQQIINATRGSILNDTGLQSQLLLDGQPIRDADLISVEAQTPQWLNFDQSSFNLTGTPPQNAISSNATVTATDVHGDVANATIDIRIDSALFTTFVPNFNVTIGEPFTYSLSPSIFSEPDVEVTSEINPAVPWITFNSSNLTWSGNVPSNAQPLSVMVKIVATSTASGASDSQSFQIQVLHEAKATGVTSTASISGSSRPTQSTGGLAASNMAENHSSLQKGIIAVAVTVPVFVLIAAVVGLCGYNRRRRRRIHTTPSSPACPDISIPVGRPDPLWPVTDSSLGEKAESQSNETPPTLPLLRTWSVVWTSNADPRRSPQLDTGQEKGSAIGVATSEAHDFGRSPLEGFNASRATTNFSLRAAPAPTSAPPPIPSKSPARRLSSMKRLSTPSKNRQSATDTTLPPTQRLSGVGHGAGDIGPPGHGVVRNSWRDSGRQTWATIRSSEQSSRTQSTDMLDHFPAPPRATVRVVRSPEPAGDPTRISASRRERYGNRPGGSPLFGGSLRLSTRSRPHQPETMSSSLHVPPENSSGMDTIDSFLKDLTSDASLHSGGSSWDRQHGSSLVPSRTTGQFMSASDSRDSMSEAPADGRFVPFVDENGERQWCRAEPGPADRDSPAGSRGASPETGEAQTLEYAVPIATSRAQRPLNLRVQSSRASNSKASIESPRLVDLKPQRPVSVNIDGHKRMLSRTVSTAFV